MAYFVLCWAFLCPLPNTFLAPASALFILSFHCIYSIFNVNFTDFSHFYSLLLNFYTNRKKRMQTNFVFICCVGVKKCGGYKKKRSRVSDAHHIFWAIHRSTMMMSTYKMDDIHENCFKLIRIIYFAHTLFIKMEFTNFLHELFFKRICN